MKSQWSFHRGLFDKNAPFAFKNLWQNRHYTDVTLANMDDKQNKALKLILSSSSTFFKHIFITIPHPNPILYLTDISQNQLKSILKFIYKGKFNVESLDIENFLATGSR